MSEYSDTLRGMINKADDQVESIEDSTALIITQIGELEEEYDAISNGMMDVASVDMSGYLEFTKLPEVGGDYVEFGADFNVTNITDWGIYTSPSTLIYKYNAVGWDSDPEIIDLINAWDFGYDYLHHTFDTSGTYGILARINQLQNALIILQSNRTKIEDSKTEFEGYAS